MPDVPGYEGGAAARVVRDADVEEELSVVRANTKVSPTERYGRGPMTVNVTNVGHVVRNPPVRRLALLTHREVGRGESGLYVCVCRARKGRRGGESDGSPPRGQGSPRLLGSAGRDRLIAFAETASLSAERTRAAAHPAGTGRRGDGQQNRA